MRNFLHAVFFASTLAACYRMTPSLIDDSSWIGQSEAGASGASGGTSDR